MNETLQAQYDASIDRLNAIAAQGRFKRITQAHAYRLELKTTMRLLRRIIADESDPEIRGMRTNQLRCLKRIHWDTIQLEAIGIVIATREN